MLALLRKLLLQPRCARERLISLKEGRCHAVVTVERWTGAPVGDCQPPLVEQLLADRGRVEPRPAVEPHEPFALRARQRGIRQRRRHAARRGRLSVAVAQRKAQSGKRRALFESADPVLELEGILPSGVLVLESQSLY